VFDSGYDKVLRQLRQSRINRSSDFCDNSFSIFYTLNMMILNITKNKKAHPVSQVSFEYFGNYFKLER
jgi:Tfp pilus assembly protein PilV